MTLYATMPVGWTRAYERVPLREALDLARPLREQGREVAIAVTGRATPDLVHVVVKAQP